MPWENQYIAKLHTRPGLIFPFDNDAVTAEQREQVQRALQPFSQIFLEIGSGSGRHLIECAARDPISAYVGIELRYKRVFRTAEKAERQGVKNLFVVRSNALLAAELFYPESLSGIYVFFPDPWPKRRWKKHRLLNPDFLTVLHALLKPGGFLSYRTDHQEYFEETVALMQDSALFSVARIERGVPPLQPGSSALHSEFESLFRSKKVPIFSLEVIRR